MSEALEVAKLDHTDAVQSEALGRLLRESYVVEARLIGVDDFAPLRRESEHIRNADSTFFGCRSEGRLLAVAEVEEDDGETANIAALVVHPSAFRQGFGSRLLRYVLERAEGARVTVSTASANTPAVALYEKHGFRVCRRWRIDGIAMVTLELLRSMDRPRS